MLRNLLTLALFVAGIAQAFASASVRADGPTVLINEVPVLRLRSSVGKAGPEARAKILASNLSKLPTIGQVKVVKARKNFLIYVSGKLVLTVTPQEAQRTNSEAATLANLWARNIRKASSVPSLSVGVNGVAKMPLGSKREIPLSGSLAGKAVVQSSDPSIATVAKGGKGLVVRAVNYGNTDIAVVSGNFYKTFQVSVQPYGASLPQQLSASVTGIPATVDTVKGAVQTAVRNQLALTKGAELTFQMPDVGQIPPGEAKTYSVRVKAAGENVLTSDGYAYVTVRNIALPRVPEAQLWYCNHPENLKKPGLLFAAPLRPDSPARLLYHHINEMPNALFVNVEAVNNSDTAARLVIIPGDAEPSKNPVLAGIDAAEVFLRRWVLGSGEIITIPAHSSVPIALRRIAHGQTMSGLCYLRLLEGGPEELTIRTDAKLPFYMDARWRTAMASPTPWRHVGTQRLNLVERDPVAPSIHVYPNPFKDGLMTYQVGGKYGFFRVGERPIARADQQSDLSGNFGVTYNIKALLENPTSEVSEVELVFEASAGYSGGLFVINNELIRTPLIQPKTEIQVTTFRLEPGVSRSVNILTVPLSGSSYPATLTLRPVGVATYARSGRK